MKAEKPKVILDGTLFTVDHNNQQFIQETLPENRILFSDLERHGDLLLLNYNTATSRVCKSINGNDKHHGIKVISIQREILSHPQLLVDRPGFCKIHNQKSYMQERNILLIDEIIGRRLDGELPKVKIGNQYYHFHSPFLFKAGKYNPENLLDHHSVIYEPPGDKFLGLYDEHNDKVKQLGNKKIGVDKHVRVFEIPWYPSFDPIGEASLRGLELTALLPTYPQPESVGARPGNLDEQAVRKMQYAGIRLLLPKKCISINECKDSRKGIKI